MIDIEKKKPIGLIIHYYSRIRVAIVELVDTLKFGDTIRITGGRETDFTQTVRSMEIDHKKIDEAKTGDSIGLKVSQRVREGYRVYKL